MHMTDKTVLITGGSGGIGAASALLFAEAGARVIVTHRPGKDAAALLARLPGKGHQALPLDVADTASILGLREAMVQAGHTTLDVLVNSAGFTKAVPHADLDALDDALIDEMFAVNWRGQFATIRAFASMLQASGDGLIVSISSIAAMNGTGSSIAYCAVKAGIDVMTKSLARALAPAVRVLAVSPGVGRDRLRSRPRRGIQRAGGDQHTAEACRDCPGRGQGGAGLRDASDVLHRSDHRRRWGTGVMSVHAPLSRVIITCAVTGNLTTPAQTQYLPITPEEIADACLEAAEAGAAVVHIHVRDPGSGQPSMELELYRDVVDRIRRCNRDLILNLTTGPGGRYVPSEDDPAVAGPGTTLIAPEKRVAHIAGLCCINS